MQTYSKHQYRKHINLHCTVTIGFTAIVWLRQDCFHAIVSTKVLLQCYVLLLHFRPSPTPSGQDMSPFGFFSPHCCIVEIAFPWEETERERRGGDWASCYCNDEGGCGGGSQPIQKNFVDCGIVAAVLARLCRHTAHIFPLSLRHSQERGRKRRKQDIKSSFFFFTLTLFLSPPAPPMTESPNPSTPICKTHREIWQSSCEEAREITAPEVRQQLLVLLHT